MVSLSTNQFFVLWGVTIFVSNMFIVSTLLGNKEGYLITYKEDISNSYWLFCNWLKMQIFVITYAAFLDCLSSS